MNKYKSYLNKELKLLLISNILVLFLLVKESCIFGKRIIFSLSSFESIYCFLSASSLIYLVSFISDSLIPAKIKDYFLLYFNACPLVFFVEPGNIIFQNLHTLDESIISISDAEDKYSTIIKATQDISSNKEKHAYQNRKWLDIYNKYRKDNSINTLNLEFLCFRDMIASIIIFGIFVLILNYCSIIVINIKNFLTIFCFEYIILLIAARNKAGSLVRRVIYKDVRNSVNL